MSNHTPGPGDVKWEMAGQLIGPNGEKTPGRYGRYSICQAAMYSEETAEANARLIAAAPEMLEACEKIAALADGQGRMNMLEVAGMARAAIAIAKAKGE